MHQIHKLFPPRSHLTAVNIDICCQWEVLRKFKAWPHRASASALTLGQCLRLDMTLTLSVGCAGVNQCAPLQASMLTLTLGVVRPLV